MIHPIVVYDNLDHSEQNLHPVPFIKDTNKQAIEMMKHTIMYDNDQLSKAHSAASNTEKESPAEKGQHR